MDSGILRRLLFRSFLIQGSWNFERMQNLGFCYAILPALKRLHGGGDGMKEAIRRHLEFFNTHPYLAAPIIGAVARMEEGVCRGEMRGDDIKTFKTGIMGSYGAIGDTFFWGTVKPLASLAALCLLLFNIAAAPLFFLLVYNVPHLYVRIAGIFGGYVDGIDVIDRMKRFDFPGRTKRLRYAILLVAGAFLALLADGRGADLPFSAAWGLTAAAVFALYFLLMRRGFSVQVVIYLSFLLTAGYSAFM